jgi:hypothetical protein
MHRMEREGTANATHKSILPNWFTAHTLNVERGGRSWREEIPGGRSLWWVLSTPFLVCFLVHLHLNLGISLLTIASILLNRYAHTLNVEHGGRSWREEIPGGRRLWWVLSTPFLVYLNLNLGISLLTLSPIDGDISFTMTSSGHFFSKWVNYRERVNSGGHFLVNSSGHFLTVITNSADTVGQPMQGMRGQSPW